MRRAKHLFDAVRAVGIRRAVEKLAQMRRGDVDSRLNRPLQQTVQREDPMRLDAVL